MSNSLEKAFNGSVLNYKPSRVYVRVWAVTGTKYIEYYMECIYIFSGRGFIVTAKERNTIIPNYYGITMEVTLNMSCSWVMQWWLNPFKAKITACCESVCIIFLSRWKLQTLTLPIYLLQNMFLGSFMHNLNGLTEKNSHSFGKKKKACKYQSLQNLEILEQHWAVCSLLIL